MKKYIIIAAILFFQGYYVVAQPATGGVFEVANGKEIPLIGATVVQLNSQNGTVTSADGHFHIDLNPQLPKVLVVSFVSYQTDTINLEETGFDHVHIALTEVKNLGEVEIVERQKGSAISRTQTRSVVNINEKELQKAACCNLSESFENSATIDVSYSDAVTGAKQIQMLGLAGIYTQLLTENIPNMRGLATPWGLGYIPGSWMESIQVSKGTSSVINGYESMTGQINIEYKKTDEGEKFFLNGYGNQKGKIEGNLNTRFQLSDKLSTAILVHAENMNVKHDLNGDSFLDQPLVSQLNLYNRWGYINRQFHVRLGFKYLKEDRQGGQMTFDPDKEHNIENGYGIGVNTDRYEGSFKLGYVFEHRAETSFGFQNQLIVHEQNSYFGLTTYDAKQVSYYSNLMFQSWITDTRHQFTTGLSYNFDKYNEALNDSIFNRTEKVPGGFIQYSYSNKKNLNVIAGLRVDAHNLFGVLVTPRIHVKYNLNEHNVIRASAGKGYRSPNVIAENTSLLATSRRLIVKEDMQIESSWNYGLSYTTYVDIGSRELSITADYFRTLFENQIIIDSENDPGTIYLYNLNGKSFSNSFQIESNYELFKNFDVTLAFRYNDVKTTINDELIEKPLVNKYKGLLALSYQTRLKTWQFDLNIQGVGNQRLPYTGYNPEEYRQPAYSPDYALINAQVTRYLKRFEVYIGGENLGNFRQTDPIIASDDPFGEYFDSSIVWGPITGIKIYAGFRFKIEQKK
ncbi:MAG: TonB-dependent receptor [Bacteroidetes bacterium]|nr:TonB-dependent receptor [Bacteroidota bacterium]MBL6944655.1 TonB-dependent receptor [Bacteroidales bacterium]